MNYAVAHYLALAISPSEVGLPNNPSISGILIKLVGIALVIVGLTSVVAIIIGGLQMVASAGDPARFKTGKQTVTYAVAGVVIAIIAGAVVQFITSRVG